MVPLPRVSLINADGVYPDETAPLFQPQVSQGAETVFGHQDPSPVGGALQRFGTQPAAPNIGDGFVGDGPGIKIRAVDATAQFRRSEPGKNLDEPNLILAMQVEEDVLGRRCNTDTQVVGGFDPTRPARIPVPVKRQRHAALGSPEALIVEHWNWELPPSSRFLAGFKALE